MALICLASPTGGAGRTTLAANLALALARARRHVIALDLDPQNALGLHFGLDPADAFGFLSTLRYAADSRAAWRAALRTTPHNVSFLPHGLVGLDGANSLSQALASAPDSLASAVRDMLAIPNVTVVADLPSGPSPALAAILPLTRLMIVPLLPDPACMAQIPVIESGRFGGNPASSGPATLPSERVALILNQLDVRTRLKRAISDAAVLHFGQRLIGTVRYDELVPEAMAAQRLIADLSPECGPAHDIAAVAASILTRLYGAPASGPGLPPRSGGLE